MRYERVIFFVSVWIEIPSSARDGIRQSMTQMYARISKSDTYTGARFAITSIQ